MLICLPVAAAAFDSLASLADGLQREIHYRGLAAMLLLWIIRIHFYSKSILLDMGELLITTVAVSQASNEATCVKPIVQPRMRQTMGRVNKNT